MTKEYVILVDENDKELWTMEKLEAHQNGGQLHRAFSVLIFNTKGEMLIQQRALDKYHCPGLWANTTCSHPRKGESYLQAAHRRLKEEMGFDSPLEEVFHFIYRAEFENGLTEYEFDRVFWGIYDGEVFANPEEVMDWKWVEVEWLRREMQFSPTEYTEWFKAIMQQFPLESSDLRRIIKG